MRANVADRKNKQRLRQVKEAIRISQSPHVMNRDRGRGDGQGGGGGIQPEQHPSTGLCLPLVNNLVVSSPSPVTSRGQGHSLMMVLDKN